MLGKVVSNIRPLLRPEQKILQALSLLLTEYLNSWDIMSI